jgi:protein involved in polysaccharide export with SLBB domain
MNAWLRALFFAVATTLVVSCAPTGAPALGGDAMGAAPLAPALGEYRLGVADKVKVTVFGEDALSGEFQVGANGSIALPLIGETQAVGLTTTEVQTRVAGALAQGYLNNPRVSVEVLNYRPFYILGEVKKPGEYPYTNSLTVLNAVATAEGFTYRADTRKVYIKRADSSVEQAYALTTATVVSPGDTIRIGERFF